MLQFSQANHGPWKILAQVVQYLKRQNDEGGGAMKGAAVELGVEKEDLRMRSRSSLNFDTIPSISILPWLTAQQAAVLAAVPNCGSR